MEMTPEEKIRIEMLREQAWAMIADRGILQIFLISNGLISPEMATPDLVRSMANLLYAEILVRGLTSKETIIKKIQDLRF